MFSHGKDIKLFTGNANPALTYSVGGAGLANGDLLALDRGGQKPQEAVPSIVTVRPDPLTTTTRDETIPQKE